MIRVLIADNNVELCQTLEQFLEEQPEIEVIGSAYDGEETLEAISKLQPDVVILDITMPRLDGMGVLERLDRMELERAPKVIVLTALGREDIQQRLSDLGAVYYLVKPFDLDVLADRIRQFGGQGEADTVSGVREQRGAYRTGRGSHLEGAVTMLLHEMGVPAHFKGYNYLRDAVLMVLRGDEPLSGTLSKHLYPRLAEKYGSTPGGVEAAIRNAVIACWRSGNREFLEKLTGQAVRLREGRFPTNSMVIAKLADRLRVDARAG